MYCHHLLIINPKNGINAIIYENPRTNTNNSYNFMEDIKYIDFRTFYV